LVNICKNISKIEKNYYFFNNFPDAAQMCRFSRVEFFQGMKTLRTDTLPGIPKLRAIPNNLKIYTGNKETKVIIEPVLAVCQLKVHSASRLVLMAKMVMWL
jgi:hypothetical protein